VKTSLSTQGVFSREITPRSDLVGWSSRFVFSDLDHEVLQIAGGYSWYSACFTKIPWLDATDLLTCLKRQAFGR
jgi:hypothetical protein